MATKKQLANRKRVAKARFKAAGVTRTAAPADRTQQRKKLARKAVRGNIRKAGRIRLTAAGERRTSTGRGTDPSK